MKPATLVRIQIVVAIVSLAITVGALYALAPLIEQADALSRQISELESRRTRMEAANAALEARNKELQRSNDAILNSAKLTPAAGDLEGWLYLGRQSSEGGWAPQSDGATPSPDAKATAKFEKVRAQKDVIVYGSIDTPTNAEAKPATGPKEPVQLIKAGTELQVLELKRQGSVGGGSLLWARIKAPADSVLVVDNK